MWKKLEIKEKMLINTCQLKKSTKMKWKNSEISQKNKSIK